MLFFGYINENIRYTKCPASTTNPTMHVVMQGVTECHFEVGELVGEDAQAFMNCYAVWGITC